MIAETAKDIRQFVTNRFKKLYNSEPLIIRSPGRINLIGEHIDYNNGFVLPAAINKNIFIAIQKRDDERIELHSADFDDSFSIALPDLKPSGKLWPDYILGVVSELLKRNVKLSGFNLVFGGDIPQGAGLSSSAALECATAFALNEIFNLGLEKVELVKISQAAENNFVGVNCGIMDQFASMFGKEQRLIKLDCNTLEYKYIPFETEDMKVVLFDTQVKHSLADSEYNVRRAECEKGLEIIKGSYPQVKTFRDVDQDMIESTLKNEGKVYDRCSYVVGEMKRLEDACNDLEKNDFASFGKRMFQTHDGLSKQYEVSCKELDILVDLVRDNNAVLGARMMGGGFGGCTINLVLADKVDEVIKDVEERYKQQAGRETKAYIAQIGDGTGIG